MDKSVVMRDDKREKPHMSLWGFVLLFVCVMMAAGWPLSDARAQSGFDDPTARTQTGASGDFVPVSADVEGGTVSIGSTAQVVLLFRNDSGRPLQAGAIQLYPSSTVAASVALNQCDQDSLPPGAVCAVALSVKGMQAGSWRIDLLMRHSGRSRLVTTTVSGTVDAGEDAGEKFVSDIEAIPGDLDFGALSTSQPVVRGIVLRNITSTPIDIDAIYIEAAEQSGYSLKSDCRSLLPGQACMVTVTWSPVLKGQASGLLLIEHSGPMSIASVNLDGSYEPETPDAADVFPEAVPGRGLLVSSQDEIDFGNDIDTTSAITVSLVNVGDAPLTLKEVKMSSSDNGVSISKRGCSETTVLQPVEACPLTVSWSPVREGAVIDDIQVVHDGARGVLVLPVRGEASGVISQDSKAVRLGESQKIAVSADAIGSMGRDDNRTVKDEEFVVNRDSDIDPASVLDGFIVTSHAPTRAIISGPGGSRIVFDGEELVLGGFLWQVDIRSSGVAFRSGPDKVLLLFDRSLSSNNRVSGQSSGGGAAASAAATAN